MVSHAAVPDFGDLSRTALRISFIVLTLKQVYLVSGMPIGGSPSALTGTSPPVDRRIDVLFPRRVHKAEEHTRNNWNEVIVVCDAAVIREVCQRVQSPVTRTSCVSTHWHPTANQSYQSRELDKNSDGRSVTHNVACEGLVAHSGLAVSNDLEGDTGWEGHLQAHRICTTSSVISSSDRGSHPPRIAMAPPNE